MIKKVFVGVLLAGVFGLLVFGAVNRTLAKSSESVSQQSEKSLDGTNGGEQTGSGNNASSAAPLNKNLNKNESRADGSGSQAGDDCETRGGKNGSSNETTSGNLNGTRQGSGQSESAPADGAGTGLAEVDAWITKSGLVESLDDELLVVNLTDGTTLEVEGRALSYALELGLSVKAGDELLLTGFMEEDEFEVGQIENITTGEIVVVRAENGRPLWAGGWH